MVKMLQLLSVLTGLAAGESELDINGLLQSSALQVDRHTPQHRRRCHRRRCTDRTTTTPTPAPTTQAPSPVEAPQCEFYNVGTPRLGTEEFASPSDKKKYKAYLKYLDVEELYDDIVKVMLDSQECWPADGPQDDDKASYAGLFERLAWHCSGTYRNVNGVSSGGCEGGRNRHWPEKEWRDNGGLDQARAILGQIKSMPKYQKLSWGDLMTFAGTVGIKASGGPASKFCFGRIDDEDGRKSIMLGSEGTTQCELGNECVSHFDCETHFRWPDQDPDDHFRCNMTQPDGRFQGSHSVGLIYVYPEGPQLKRGVAGFDATQVHQRSQSLSALEVRDTFTRMGWTDQETVALIGGGHTLGRMHGNCAANTNPQEQPCIGEFTSTSGFNGAWTRTPSQWNYDYFEAMLKYKWMAAKSPDGQDQWGPDSNNPFVGTYRLTADLALVTDKAYKKWALKYDSDHDLFDNDWADAWFKLTHRSGAHPNENDLEKDANKCTSFEFLSNADTDTSDGKKDKKGK